MINTKEYKREYLKKWRINNPEYLKNWKANNLEKQREYNRKWNINNREKRREYNKKWAVNNPEYQPEYQREWRVSNPEKMRELQLKYHFGSVERYNEAMVKYDGWCAFGCGETGQTKAELVHHLDGKSIRNFPEEEIDNSLKNLLPLCKSCHMWLHHLKVKGVKYANQ